MEPSSSVASAEARYELLRQHGRFTLAYAATFEPGLQYFGDRNGFIAYKMVWGTAMVLADPVASAEHAPDLIDRFLAEHSDVTFWQASHATVTLLAARGFIVNELGPDCRIDLAGYSFDGSSKRNLRKATSRAQKLGYVTRECSGSEVSVDDIKAVSGEWKKTRTLRRTVVVFLNRRLAFEQEPDVRRFCTFDRDGRLIGFGVFDPVYEAGQIVGYSTSNVRHRPEADGMIGHLIKRVAIETFQKENRKWVFLGLSPADQIHDKQFEHDWLVRRSLRFIYTNGLFNRLVYPLQGHALHKAQFGGVFEQTYVAFNQRPCFVRLLKLARACDVI